MEEVKIRLKRSTTDKLKEIKIIDRESYDSVINRVLDERDYEDSLELSDELKQGLKKGIEDIKEGKVYSSKEAREKLKKIRGKGGKWIWSGLDREYSWRFF